MNVERNLDNLLLENKNSTITEEQFYEPPKSRE
jgi:hypothetical protein